MPVSIPRKPLPLSHPSTLPPIHHPTHPPSHYLTTPQPHPAPYPPPHPPISPFAITISSDFQKISKMAKYVMWGSYVENALEKRTPLPGSPPEGAAGTKRQRHSQNPGTHHRQHQGLWYLRSRQRSHRAPAGRGRPLLAKRHLDGVPGLRVESGVLRFPRTPGSVLLPGCASGDCPVKLGAIRQPLWATSTLLPGLGKGLGKLRSTAQ